MQYTHGHPDVHIHVKRLITVDRPNKIDFNVLRACAHFSLEWEGSINSVTPHYSEQFKTTYPRNSKQNPKETLTLTQWETQTREDSKL